MERPVCNCAERGHAAGGAQTSPPSALVSLKTNAHGGISRRLASATVWSIAAHKKRIATTAISRAFRRATTAAWDSQYPRAHGVYLECSHGAGHQSGDHSVAVNGQPDCPQRSAQRAGRRPVDTAQLNVWTRIDRARPRQFPGNRAGKQRCYERSRYQRAIPSAVKDGSKRQIIAQEAPVRGTTIGRAFVENLKTEQ